MRNGFYWVATAMLVLSQTPRWAASEEGEKVPENPAKAGRGIETGSWSMEAWGNSGSTERIPNAERLVLKVIYTGGEKDKTSFKHLTGLTASPDGKARMHVYAPEDASPDVALSISTTPAFLWHESRSFKLKKGWNAIEIPLGSKNWKTQKTEWKFSTGIEHLNDIRAVNLIVMNAKATGWLYVEGLALDPDDTGKKVAGLITALTDQDPEKRAQAEADLVAIGRPAIEALYQVRATDRPEVLLRASWALRKIESVQEELPKDPELRTMIEKQKEEDFFGEARRRADYILKGLQTERAKILQVAKEAREELARSRTELQNLKVTSEEDRKAYMELLAELDRLSKEMLQVFETPAPAKDAEKEKKPAAETVKGAPDKKDAPPKAEEKTPAPKL